MPDKRWRLLTTKFPSNNPPLTRFVSEYVVNDNGLFYGLSHKTAESAHARIVQLAGLWEFKLWDAVDVALINDLTHYEFLSVGQHPDGVHMYVLCLPLVAHGGIALKRKKARRATPTKHNIPHDKKQLTLF